MKTNGKKIWHLEEGKDYVILLSSLEFAMPKEQLEHITELHNEGMWINDIAIEVERNPYEVLIALIHQVQKGRRLRPIAFRGK